MLNNKAMHNNYQFSTLTSAQLSIQFKKFHHCVNFKLLFSNLEQFKLFFTTWLWWHILPLPSTIINVFLH